MGGKKLQFLFLFVFLLSIGLADSKSRFAKKTGSFIGKLAANVIRKAAQKKPTTKQPIKAVHMAPMQSAYPNHLPIGQFNQTTAGAPMMYPNGVPMYPPNGQYMYPQNGGMPIQGFPIAPGNPGAQPGPGAPMFNPNMYPANGGMPPQGFPAVPPSPGAQPVPGAPMFNPNPNMYPTNGGMPVYTGGNFPVAPGSPGAQPAPIAPQTPIQPDNSKKNSASAFSINAGCFGLIAVITFLMSNGNRLYL